MKKKNVLRQIDATKLHDIKRKCLRWYNDNVERLKASEPLLPMELTDRQQDCWESLYIIAEIAGGDWLEKANRACLEINKSHSSILSKNEQLLVEIKTILSNYNESKIFTQDLLERLLIDDEAIANHWSGENKPLTKRQFSIFLKSYKLESKDVRIGSDIKKGYEVKDFNDVFDRYISKKQSTTLNATTWNSKIIIKNKILSCDLEKCSDVAYKTGDEMVDEWDLCF